MVTKLCILVGFLKENFLDDLKYFETKNKIKIILIEIASLKKNFNKKELLSFELNVLLSKSLYTSICHDIQSTSVFFKLFTCKKKIISWGSPHNPKTETCILKSWMKFFKAENWKKIWWLISHARNTKGTSRATSQNKPKQAGTQNH